MWLNKEKLSDSSIRTYRQLLKNSCPNHVVIDGFFNESKLDEVMTILHSPQNWQTQKHTYSALYVDDNEWSKSKNEERFVQRDIWLRAANRSKSANTADSQNPCLSIADDFLAFLRGDEFMSVLSRIFNVTLTDKNVADPNINTNYFRLSASDFVKQHADDSPGREVCMLLYLNKEWESNAGGELVFLCDEEPISVLPLYNRCVLFDPSSKGSEHLVKRLCAGAADVYRYNVTSWYWSE